MNTALAQGQLMSVSIQAGARLLCHQGRLLVTLEGVSQDFDLRAGQFLTLLNDGLLVVEALLPAQLELAPALVAVTRRHFGWSRWTDGVLAFVSRTRAGPRLGPPGISFGHRADFRRGQGAV